jgi:hypothetical protein
MKKKIKLLAIVVFFLLGIWLLKFATTLSPCQYLGWLSWLPVQVEAQTPNPAGCPLCPTCDPGCFSAAFEPCLTFHICSESVCRSTCLGHNDGPDKHVDTPPPPPDEVDPGGRENVYDPETFTEACPTCSLEIGFDFPRGAVSAPVQVRAYHTGLPPGVPAPTGGIIGCPFFFGAWIKGEGKTVDEFNEPIVIKVSDNNMAIPVAQENQLRLNMYDPTTEAWVKLCSRAEGKQLSAALVFPTPLEEGGNALFALTIDDTPALDQVVDEQGKTTLSIPDDNIKIGVLPGTVEVGTYFEMTHLSNTPDSGLFKLLPTPVDVKACQADYTTPNKVRQVTRFPKPLEVTFGFDANTLTRAGGKNNLTIVSFQNRQWMDLEEFGASVVRSDNTITVESSNLGTFSMAVR